MTRSWRLEYSRRVDVNVSADVIEVLHGARRRSSSCRGWLRSLLSLISSLGGIYIHVVLGPHTNKKMLFLLLELRNLALQILDLSRLQSIYPFARSS